MKRHLQKTLLSKKHSFPKNPLFSKKTHCFPTCALFYPIVLKRKIITDYNIGFESRMLVM